MGTLVAAGTHKLTAMGNMAIWDSDLKTSIEVFPAVPYVVGAYVIPGVGHVEYVGWDPFADSLNDVNEAVAIQSGPGDWKFVVDTKAMMPTPNGPVEGGPGSADGTFSVITVQPVCTST